MLKIVEMEFSLYGKKSDLPKVDIRFYKIEATDGERVYGITSYESRSFEYNVETKEILNPERKISLMNGKEHILTAAELFVGDNKVLLDDLIAQQLGDREREVNLPSGMSQEVMKFVFSLHEKHEKQACINLIDRALETGDIELFERMTAKLGTL